MRLSKDHLLHAGAGVVLLAFHDAPKEAADLLPGQAEATAA